MYILLNSVNSILNLIFPIPFHVFKHHITVVRLTLLKWNQFSCPGVPLGFSHTHRHPLPGDWADFGTPKCLMQGRNPGFPLVLELMCSPSFQLQTQLHRLIGFIEQICSEVKGLQTPEEAMFTLWMVWELAAQTRAGWPTAFSDTEFSANSQHALVHPSFPRRCEKKCKSFHMSIPSISWEVLGNGLKGFLSKWCYTMSIHYLPLSCNTSNTLFAPYEQYCAFSHGPVCINTVATTAPDLSVKVCFSVIFTACLNSVSVVCLLQMIIQGFAWLTQRNSWRPQPVGLILLLQGFK